jgi:hypothetical protein
LGFLNDINRINDSRSKLPPRFVRFGGTKVRQEAGAISRWKSGPGKAQQAAWKRVLRESDGNAGREAYTAVAWGV